MAIRAVLRHRFARFGKRSCRESVLKAVSEDRTEGAPGGDLILAAHVDSAGRILKTVRSDTLGTDAGTEKKEEYEEAIRDPQCGSCKIPVQRSGGRGQRL